jgi:predicted phage terminase large subunit-like protein
VGRIYWRRGDDDPLQSSPAAFPRFVMADDEISKKKREDALQLLIERARTDFRTYVLLCNPKESGFKPSKFHMYLVALVQGVADGVRKLRQAVSCPPQHGKSTMLSIEATAWIMGRRPGIQCAITGYSQDLTVSFARRVRARLTNPMHLMIFPDAAPRQGFDRADAFECNNGSSLRAKSTGAKLTGRKVDWLIIDDPHAGRAEAESAAQRKKVYDWYSGDCYTRLSPNAAVFLIQTRWHPEDLNGMLTNEDRIAELRALDQEKEVFEVTNLAAVAEEGVPDPLCRAPGEALFPEIRDRGFLDSVKAALPSYEWESQYQGHPTGHSGGQFDERNLRYCGPDDLIKKVPDNIERVRAWDLALTEKQTADFTAGAKCAYDPDENIFYIVDMFKNRGTWVKNEKIVTRYALDDLRDGVLRVGIEAVAGFLIAYQTLQAKLLGKVKVEPRRVPRGDKLTHALPWLNMIEAKRVVIVRGPWNKDFIAELKIFPDGAHDDQVDAVSRAWEMLTWRYRHLIYKVQAGGRPNATERPKTVRPAKLRQLGFGKEGAQTPLDKAMQYIQNTGGSPTIAAFDDDHAPIGAKLREDLKNDSRVYERDGKIFIDPNWKPKEAAIA